MPCHCCYVWVITSEIRNRGWQKLIHHDERVGRCVGNFRVIVRHRPIHHRLVGRCVGTFRVPSERKWTIPRETDQSGQRGEQKNGNYRSLGAGLSTRLVQDRASRVGFQAEGRSYEGMVRPFFLLLNRSAGRPLLSISPVPPCLRCTRAVDTTA
jgi:hypothetical protein